MKFTDIKFILSILAGAIVATICMASQVEAAKGPIITNKVRSAASLTWDVFP
jgi:hypothetical protein